MFDWSVPQRVVIPPASSHSEENVHEWRSIGKIYEHLACFYLASIGFEAEIKGELGYDILCTCPDGRFFKVEVKSGKRTHDARVAKRIRHFGNPDGAKPGRVAFGGMVNKDAADLIMFIERDTNFMVLRLADELPELKRQYVIPSIEFSKFYTNYHLNRVAVQAVPADTEYVFPDAKEQIKLNRSWARDNVDLIQDMYSKGIPKNKLGRIFGLDDKSGKWVNRLIKHA